ncbi:hypothetical protein [Streptomyces sennicomposti]
MTKALARLIFETWAAQYDIAPDVEWNREAHSVLRVAFPHTYPPNVLKTFRGPKWGQR